MTISIQSIDSRSAWDSFLDRVAPHTFLHTWEWGDFQHSYGYERMRIGLYRGPQLIGVALLIVMRARRGRFLFCPHGPIIDEQASDVSEALAVFLDYCKKVGREKGCLWVRVCPLLLAGRGFESVFQMQKYRDAPIHMHPERAWILSLDPDEDTLLAAMRKNVRYAIRKAAKDGVKITSSDDASAIDQFYDLYLQTVKRQQFTPFPRSHIEQELACFHTSGAASARIFFAEYQGAVVSTAFIVFTRWSAFYHHGAASLAYPKIPASHLLQWEIIREAKKNGCRFYNFWGLAHDRFTTPLDHIVRIFRRAHPWEGLTLFKTGFGGFEQMYVHAQDYPLDARYWAAYAVEYARKLKRGL